MTSYVTHLTLLAFVATAATAPTTAFAQVAPSAVPDSVEEAAVRTWLRSESARLMKWMDIPGAVLTVVHHDRVIINEGVGFADVEKRTPVDATTTVFRIASVSKVFTAATVLQLSQSGRLSLTQDLRPLLPDVLTRADLDSPVTLHQLLTHTAGFDEQLIGYLNPTGTVTPLADYLAASLPRRTRTAHDVPGYSNHGYGLAGLAVERIAKQPFDVFARDSVFVPLGMRRTAFIADPTNGAPAGLASEYRSDGVRRTPRSSRAYPAGNIGTTGTDMIAFMQWLLAGLRSTDSASPSSRIAHQLAGPVLTYDPALPPMGYGLSGVPIAGRTVWMKGGASPSHSAVLAIIPELDVALFFAVNRQEPLFWDHLLPDLVRKFWPDSSGVDAVLAAATAPTIELDGDYRWTRSPLESVEKLLGLAAQVRVSTTGSGIRVTGFELDGDWLRTGPQTFRDSTGRELSFRADENGRASYLFSIVGGQPVALENIALPDTTRFQLGTFVLASVLCLAAALAALKRPIGDMPPVWARRSVMTLPVVVALALIAGFVLAVQGDVLLQGPTVGYYTALTLTTIAGLVAIAQVAGSFTLASRHNATRLKRSIYTVGAFGGAGVLWFLATNHLIQLPFGPR